MSDSPKADAWFNGGLQIPWGWDPDKTGNTESIASSLVATNRAAHSALNMIGPLYGKIDQVYPLVQAVAHDAAWQVLHGERWKYQNQPQDGEGTDDLQQSVNATNGQVHRNAALLDALRTEVAAVQTAVSAPAAGVADLHAEVQALRALVTAQGAVLQAVAKALKIQVAG